MICCKIYGGGKFRTVLIKCRNAGCSPCVVTGANALNRTGRMESAGTGKKGTVLFAGNGSLPLYFSSMGAALL